MQEKVSDLVYAVRSLCEYLRDKQDFDRDDELIEIVEDIEECLDEIGGVAED